MSISCILIPYQSLLIENANYKLNGYSKMLRMLNTEFSILCKDVKDVKSRI